MEINAVLDRSVNDSRGGLINEGKVTCRAAAVEDLVCLVNNSSVIALHSVVMAPARLGQPRCDWPARGVRAQAIAR